jgi:hypothetical protein
MPKCAGIKRDGGRCTVVVAPGVTHCYSHDPERAEERRRNASRGGRAKGNKEVAELKTELKDLISEVKAGELDRNDAAVMVQGYRALKDFIELERRLRETDDLAAEIEELKREYGLAG